MVKGSPLVGATGEFLADPVGKRLSHGTPKGWTSGAEMEAPAQAAQEHQEVVEQHSDWFEERTRPTTEAGRVSILVRTETLFLAVSLLVSESTWRMHLAEPTNSHRDPTVREDGAAAVPVLHSVIGG